MVVSDLYSGLLSTLVREVPAKSLYISGFNSITRFFCLLPFVDANNADLKLLVMLLQGPWPTSQDLPEAPFELLSRQLQTGVYKTEEAAVAGLLADTEGIQETGKLFRNCSLRYHNLL